MKKTITIMVILAALMLSGCEEKQEQNEVMCTADVQECSDGSFVSRDSANGCAFKACPEQVKGCTKELKVCDDGTTVGRNSENNCEFDECPAQDGFGMQIDRRYVERNNEACKNAQIRMGEYFTCIEGARPFFDETGCGCEPKEQIKYVSNSSEQCMVIRYMCDKNYAAFSDETGCGCIFDWGGELPEEEPTKTFCEPEQRGENIACTMDYTPVCGWFNPDVKCIKYPCAATYGNACGACADSKVEYHTAGECPQ